MTLHVLHVRRGYPVLTFCCCPFCSVFFVPHTGRGAFEWDGDWSDNSPLWKKHTGVALEIGKPEEKEDGIFYMSWEDFIRLFNTVDVLYPSYGVRDIHYRVVETDPYCGTCRGCFWGCLKYWLCLKGLRTLWFEQSSAELKAALDKDKDEGSRMLSLV